MFLGFFTGAVVSSTPEILLLGFQEEWNDSSQVITTLDSFRP